MKNAGIWMGVLILAFAGLMFWQSLSFDYYRATGPGPGLFPLWLSGVLIIQSLIYIWQSIKKQVVLFQDIMPKGKDAFNVTIIPVSIVIFIIMASFTGFNIAGTVMLYILFMRDYKWYWGLGISALVTVALFLVFQILLSVPLPVNTLGW